MVKVVFSIAWWAAVLIVLSFGSPLRAQDVAPAFKCPAVGAVITTSAGETRTFTGQDGFVCLFTSSDSDVGANGKRFADLWQLNSTLGEANNEQVAELQALWPLKPGNKATDLYSRIYDQKGSRFDVTVDRFETITVPAGTFDAAVIKVEETAVKGFAHETAIYWYAYQIGMTVKLKTELAGKTHASEPDWEATILKN